MTAAEIARRANMPVSVAIRYLSRVMDQSLTADSMISRKAAGYAILTLTLVQGN